MFNFGNPDIRRINLVSKLLKINNKIGITVNKCIIKKFGFSLLINFFNGKYDCNKILK